MQLSFPGSATSAVGVSTVLDAEHDHFAKLIIYAVQHAIGSSAG